MKDGDFIRIEYEMRAGDDSKLVATNNEELAKQNDIYEEDGHYSPSIIIVGADNLLPKINESFLTAEKGKEVTVEMTAAEGFGERDPKNIRVHTYREFQKNNIEPAVGNEIVLNNRRGRVLSVTPGRVLVDYNHQWAGRKIVYKYTVVDVIEKNLDKMRALVDMYYAYRSAQFTFEEGDGRIDLTIPETSKFDPAWIEAKYEIVNNARKYLKESDIYVIEKYEKPPEEKVEEKPSEEPAPEEAPAEAEEKPSEHEEAGEAKAEQGEKGTEAADQ